MNKILYGLSAILFATIIIFLATQSESAPADGKNVSVVDGKQIIEITAKAGYSPQKTIAQANLPTILKVKTTGTFDCSAALNIPNLKYSEVLPMNGTTEIPVPTDKTSGKLQGLCAMGMYNFEIDFV
jgi:plastocyanin domain-containing protein